MDGNILILDYSDFEREKIKYLLRLTGDFNIITIASISEYYSQMDSFYNISLLIMDIAFPDETEGFEILNALKKSSCRNAPVIITARSEKLEFRDRAAKIGVSDYIIKPYNSNRLESSIRSFVKVENKFYYDTKDIDGLTMSFDYFFEMQKYIADAVKQPFSIIVITILGANDGSLSKDAEFLKRVDKACTTALDVIRPMLSICDAAVKSSNGKEILLVLPLTDSSFAGKCKQKVEENIDAELAKTGEAYEDYFYSVSVTYPEEGKDFQTLMKNALNKVADKDLHEKAGNITPDTRKYANKQYNRYNKWF